MNYYQDYYNYENNNYNKPLYNENYNKKNIYDPYNGFIRGNLFPDLYNTYKISNPYNIEPMNDQAKLLTEIDSLCFALTDLNLYLDINRNDKDIINLYNQYRQKKTNLLEQYQNKYGPITLDSESLNKTPWGWDNSPWPWEN